MIRKLVAGALSVVLLLTIGPIQGATAAPPWWGNIKDIVIADALGAIDGYLSSGTGLGALFGGIKGSLAAIEGPSTGGAKWKAPELNISGIGYHHNMALDEVLNALLGQDIHSEKADELTIAYLDKAYGSLLRGKKGYDHYLKSMDPTFDAIMTRIQEALKAGKISDQLYANLREAIAVLQEETDSPEVLVDKATPILYDEIKTRNQRVIGAVVKSDHHGGEIGLDPQPMLDTLSLNFEKLVVVYNPKARVIGEGIIVLVPGRSGIAPMVEAMDIIVATVFEDALRHSYDYWRHTDGTADDAGQLSPWWNKHKDVVIAHAIGSVEGYLSTGSGWGALFSGIRASLSAIQSTVTGGTAWRPEAVNELSIGFHHNKALGEILRQITADGMGTKEVSDKVQELALGYVVRAYEAYLLANNPYFVPGTLAPQSEVCGETCHFIALNYRKKVPSYGWGMGSRDFAAKMGRVREALEQGRISDQFYANAQRALAVLEEDTDAPQGLIDKAASLLYTGIVSSSGLGINVSGDLLLDFDKIRIVYEPPITASDTEDIIVLVPGRAGLAPQVEAMDILLATIFEDVLRHSYDYWSSGPSASTPITLILTLNSTKVLSNGTQKVVDVAPVVRNGRTLVPFRFIGEELGAEIDWDQATQMVSYKLGETTIQLWIGKNQALVNGKAVPIDVNPSIVPIVVRGRTLVPFRFIGEALGFEVGYDDKTEQVSIKGKHYSPTWVVKINPLYKGNE
jgi:hypothetical protein